MRYRYSVTFGILLVLVSTSTLAEESLAYSGSKRTPQYTEAGAEGCLRCHSGPKMHAVAATEHGNLQEWSLPMAVHACEACHGPGSIHVSRAHGGRGFPPLTRFGRGSGVSSREIQIKACLSCHETEMGKAQAIEFLGSPHDKRAINCSSCHRVHLESDPMNDKALQLETCYRCHRKQKTEHPRFEDKSIDFDALSCGTCHNVHKVLDDEE